MDFISQLQALLALISKIQSENVDLALKIEEVKKASYDEGFAAGVASVPVVGTDKIYSQEELDKAVAASVEPLQKKIVELEEQVSKIDQIVSDKLTEFKTAFKSELAEKLKQIDLAEDEAVAKLFE